MTHTLARDDVWEWQGLPNIDAPSSCISFYFRNSLSAVTAKVTANVTRRSPVRVGKVPIVKRASTAQKLEVGLLGSPREAS